MSAGHRSNHSARSNEQPLAELTEKLRHAARKITGPRQAILEVLRKQPHPLSNKEIHQALGKADCDLATIYRTMHTLEKMGLVMRFDFGDGVARFELNCGDARDHHHHLICTECSRVVELEDCFPPALEQSIAQKHRF